MIHRVHKNNNYSVMPNCFLRDMNLSLKARGLMGLMFSLPEDWNYSAAGLETLCKDGIDAINSALREIEKAGYLKRTPLKTGGKITDWQYDIYESPLVDFPQMDFPQMENPRQLNKDKQNIDKLNKDIYNPPIVPPKGGDGEYSENFKKFWDAYPNRTGKREAYKAFNKVKVSVDVLISAVEAQKKTEKWQRENGRYIPNPATWLNQGRWEDDVPEEKANTAVPTSLKAGDAYDELEAFLKGG